MTAASFSVSARGLRQGGCSQTVYYLKHPGPNLSLWRAPHMPTSLLKCAFHAACQRDQSGSGRLHRFPSSCFSAPSPTDKMSQFGPNGSDQRQRAQADGAGGSARRMLAPTDDITAEANGSFWLCLLFNDQRPFSPPRLEERTGK